MNYVSFILFFVIPFAVIVGSLFTLIKLQKENNALLKEIKEKLGKKK